DTGVHAVDGGDDLVQRADDLAAAVAGLQGDDARVVEVRDVVDVVREGLDDLRGPGRGERAVGADVDVVVHGQGLVPARAHHPGHRGERLGGQRVVPGQHADRPRS